MCVRYSRMAEMPTLLLLTYVGAYTSQVAQDSYHYPWHNAVDYSLRPRREKKAFCSPGILRVLLNERRRKRERKTRKTVWHIERQTASSMHGS